MNKYLIITTIILALITGNFFLTSGFTGDAISTEGLERLTLKVAIPCPGHAGLIKYYLNNLDGIKNIGYTPITTFVVYYNSTKISEQDILNLDIFKDYPTKKIN